MGLIETFVEKFVDFFVSNHVSLMGEDFSSPYQITVINENYNHRVIFLTKHDPECPDKKITVLTADSEGEARERVDCEVLNDPYWMKNGYAIALASVLSEALRTPLLKCLSKPACIGAYNIISKQAETSPHYPKLVKFYLDFKKTTVEEVLQENGWIAKVQMGGKAESQATVEEKTATPTIEENSKKHDNRIFLAGALWYPPIVFKDQPLCLNHKFILQTDYRGYKVLFDSQSMIFITSPLKESSESFAKQATKLLNEIIAVAQIRGIEGSTISVKDIITYGYDKDLKGFSSRSFDPNASVRSLIVENIEEEDMTIYEFDRHLDFQIKKLQELKDVITVTEKISENNRVSDYLISFLDAKTHYLIEQYKTSFLLAWTIIEKYIDGLWEDTLSERKVSNKRKEKLIKSNLWTSDDKLETLNLMDLILNERFEEIKRLKKIRNDTVHTGQVVTKRETEECLRFCTTVIKEMICDKCFIEL